TEIVAVKTSTCTVCVFVQPCVFSVPVTVYTVVAAGLTVVVPAGEPLSQLKLSAPDAVSVAVPPTHICVGLADASTLGFGFTSTRCCAPLVQPDELLPVTL